MNSLYIDTTTTLKIGLLNSQLNWLKFIDTKANKTAQYLHKFIHELLLEYGIESLEDLQNIFVITGPGSYTGLRIAKGLIDLLRWQKINVYSFYLHEIPKIAGIENGQFICNAFKKQLFQYVWSVDQSSCRLISSKIDVSTNKLFNDKESSNIFTNDLNFPKFIHVDKFIMNQPRSLFSSIIEKSLMKEIFYFRKIEEEFKVTGNV